MPQPPGVYITLERQIKYGRTKGCPGCETAPKKHSAECRARFEKLLAEEPAPGLRASGSAGEGQDSSFRQPDSRNGGDAPMEVEVRSSDAVRALEVAVPGTPGEKEVKFYDERTGEPLETSEVYKGRDKELTKMESFNVKNDITYAEAKAKGLRLVRSRWIDTAKEIDGKPGVRSRLVAQEVNTYKREDVSMGTPLMRVRRAIISHATAKPGEKQSRKLVARYDVSVAFFHADNSEKIAVIPPASEGTPDIVWELNKAMNGTREASRQWGVKIRKVKTADGFDELLLCPNTYYKNAADLCLSCRRDDFLASGEKEELDALDKLMAENYEVRILPRIGDPRHGGEVAEGRRLGRVIRWTEEGFTWESDPKYSPQVIEELDLKGCKGVDTPASKSTGIGVRNAECELDRERAEKFRRVAGTILYMSVRSPILAICRERACRRHEQAPGDTLAPFEAHRQVHREVSR